MYVVRRRLCVARVAALVNACVRARRVCMCVRARFYVYITYVYERACVCVSVNVCVSRQYTVSVILRFWRLRRHQHGGFPRARSPYKKTTAVPRGGTGHGIFFLLWRT